MVTAKRDIVIFPGHLCNARLLAHQIDALRDIANLQVADLYGQDHVAQLAANALALAPRVLSHGPVLIRPPLHEVRDELAINVSGELHRSDVGNGASQCAVREFRANVSSCTTVDDSEQKSA